MANITNILRINSQSGSYDVSFGDQCIESLSEELTDNVHVVIDRNVKRLHQDLLHPLIEGRRCVEICASEETKSLEFLPNIVSKLVENEIRRDHLLLAIGGGITQDIVAFLSSCLLRGISWIFIPTTLLAQADSCIGSKSSINCGSVKNLLGTFNPPKEIFIVPHFLSTLSIVEIKSGIGEILKVCAIDSQKMFSDAKNVYSRMLSDPHVLEQYIRSALEIKKKFVEEDEFDRGIRNIFNYGHSFGHAIEAATNFRIPHGIAVSIGMDMANFVAMNKNICAESIFSDMHSVLEENFREFKHEVIDKEIYFTAISRDKKNLGRENLNLILPGHKGNIQRMSIKNDQEFRHLCEQYFISYLANAEE